MDLEQFGRQLAAHRDEVEHAMRRTLPVKVGRIAKDHFQDNFRKGGFVDDALRPWSVTRRQQSGSKAAGANYGPLQSGHNVLFGAIKYIPGDGRVIVRNDLKYAPIHNEGGTVMPTVTPGMRAHAWKMYYKAIGKRKGAKRKKKYVETEEAQHWKALALTKKKKLTVRIPKRQFLGESKALDRKIEDCIDKTLSDIINK
ncbi:MAG: hypothetical protein IJ190_00900 [Prevotella sp.]|nr:hypothetical protein [Prevotella sp.]